MNYHESRPFAKARSLDRSATKIPVNVHAERAVLGAILEMDGLFTDVIAAGLKSNDFSLRDHGRIYTAMIQLEEAKQPIDHISVAEKLGNTAEDFALLSDLVVGVVLERSHILHHLGTITEKARLREIQRLGEEILFAVNEPGIESLELAFQIVSKLDQIIEEKTKRGALRELSAHQENFNEQWKDNTYPNPLPGENCGTDRAQMESRRSEQP
jgi:replicative DNA helicase